MKRLAALCLMFLCGFVSAQEAEPQSGIFLIKTDSLGNVEWERVYAEGEDCWGFAKPASDGGYTVMASIECADEEYLWMAKINSKGNIVWEKKICGESQEKKKINLCDFIETDNGYLIKVNQYEMFRERELGVLFIKIDKKGNMMWNRLAGPDIRLQAFGPIIPCKDGGFVCTGGLTLCLMKVDSLYHTSWIRFYEDELGIESFIYRASQTHDNGFIVVGINTQKGSSQWHSFSFKTDSLGSVKWFRDYKYGGISDVTAASNGGYVLTGSLGNDVWFLKVDENGSTLWSRTFGGTETDESSDRILSVSDGGYIVLGSTQNYIWLLRTDSQGDTLWTRTFSSPYKGYEDIFEETPDGGYIISGYILQPIEPE